MKNIFNTKDEHIIQIGDTLYINDGEKICSIIVNSINSYGEIYTGGSLIYYHKYLFKYEKSCILDLIKTLSYSIEANIASIECMINQKNELLKQLKQL